MIKKIVNIAGPLCVGAYTIAYAVSHDAIFNSYTEHPYAVTSLMVVIIGLIAWLSYGIADIQDL